MDVIGTISLSFKINGSSLTAEGPYAMAAR